MATGAASADRNDEATIMWDGEDPTKYGLKDYIIDQVKYVYQGGASLLKSARHMVHFESPSPTFNTSLKIDEMYKKQPAKQRICQIWKQALHFVIDLAFINQEGIQFYHNPSRVTLIPVLRSYTIIGLCVGMSYFHSLAAGIYLFAFSYLFTVALKLSLFENPFREVRDFFTWS